MADGSDQCIMLTRILDNENTDSAFLSREISGLIAAVDILFVEGKCVEMFGYTSLMLKTLSEPIVWAVKGQVNSIGIVGGVPQDIINKCLARMACWSKLLRATVAAEFPSFGLVNVLALGLLIM
eukprot:1508861-Karenia_brevis.AAC.1